MDVSMALNGLRICWGVKVEGGKRLRCGEPVNDPKTIEEVNRLINEFLKRVERRKDVLLSESNTPFDKAINELSNWLTLMETKVKETNDENIMRMRRAMINIGEKMLTLAKQAREKWLTIYRKELEKLIEGLRKREVKVIINGEPFNIKRSFIAHLYTDHLSIAITKIRGSGVTINISLVGSRGTNIITSKLFSDDTLRPMQYGWLMTDASITHDYPTMGTNQLWQSVMWILTWPRENYVHIYGVNLNVNDVNIKWYLVARDHRNKFTNKVKVAEEASKLDDEKFPIFFTICRIR
ncbi:hypothetical protein Vdis_0702 [Vulcanisaeta distributa DSM 14429]|uniref:Uncharacterized protein n=2 Tax=Vulcanisaeta distributa TaxID=164451 RepID=E1QNC5_VULDI|nr:hypothetical protein Vdis_0702 [Vulcanisaeta distributa DSM 14429]